MNLTENTISNRDNRRDIATLRGVTSKRRKRVRRHNSITQRTKRRGNRNFSRSTSVKGSQRHDEGLNDKKTDLHTYIRPFYTNGHMNKENQGLLGQNSIPMYDGVIQIGGQEKVRPTPRRRVGKGNKLVPGRCNLAAMRQVNSVDMQVQPIVPPITATGAFLEHGRGTRQTTLGDWFTNSPNNIDPIYKDSPQLLCTEFAGVDDAALQHRAAIEQVINKRNAKVLEANGHSIPSLTPSQRVGEGSQDIISFEHININGINLHDNFAELTNTMGILDTMEAGVYSIVETQWDTTCPKFCKFIRAKMKEHDTYAKAAFGSKTDESFLTSWKPGGTMVGVSGRWASRMAKSGTDDLGRWSWMDLRGKKGKTIRVISAYRVSQEHPAKAGETTSCKQQVRSLMLRGVKNPNPKKRFLEDLATMITSWRNSAGGEIILMADMNEFIGDKKALHTFCQATNLIDSISLLNPDLHSDPTYLWGKKRIYYILISPSLAEVAVKAGHHNYHQHFISDHKGLYIQFHSSDLFDIATMDRSHAAYRRLRMGRRDIVDRYISYLKRLYKSHDIWRRAEQWAQKVLNAPSAVIAEKYFKNSTNLIWNGSGT